MFYISGPITGIDQAEASYRFMQAEARLRRRGIPAINPMAAMETLPPLTHEQYMTICFAMMESCSTIYMLRGWEKSDGAKQELKRAIQRGMKIMVEHAGEAISGESTGNLYPRPEFGTHGPYYPTINNPSRPVMETQTVFVRDGKLDTAKMADQLNKQHTDMISASIHMYCQNLRQNAGITRDLGD